MRKRKRRRRVKPAAWLALAGTVLLVAMLAFCVKPETSQEPIAPPAAVQLPPATASPSQEPAEYEPDETEVELLARMLWGEARGIPSDMEKAACVWCVLNRVDDESGAWPDTIAGVLSQKNQFAGYSADYPATDELKALAADVLTRWHREKTEGGDVGRVLPANYRFFTGDGQNNHFRAGYKDDATWDWGLPNPYDD